MDEAEGEIYGDAGILSYHPIDADQSSENHVGSLNSSRYTENEPRFCIVGATAELYPPSISARPSSSSATWRARREQQRWLINSHPEAGMVNCAFQDALREDMQRFKKPDAPTSNRPLFAIGTMPYVTGRPGSKPVPFLASASGESGQLLRLTAADETDWQWGDSRDAFLRLSVIDPLRSETEISWATDGLPITQIKYEEGLSNQGPVRWLLVQKATSTTILQPERHGVPVSVNPRKNNPTSAQTSALVRANPILKLHLADTGGNAHSDVVFSSGALGQAPVLALIDECGMWSIWDLMGTYRVGLDTIRVMRRSCGHINEGLFPEFPVKHKYQAEEHRLLVVSKPVEDGRDPLDTDSRHSPSSSPILLMWNSDRLEAVDMHAGAMISPSEIFWEPASGSCHILDVQKCPIRESRVFILTERCLVWAEIRRGEKNPASIHTVPHIGRGLSRCKMTTCAFGEDTAMVFVYSVKTKQMFVYWFADGVNGEYVRWHRYVTHIPGEGEFPAPSRICHISVTPLQLHLSDAEHPTGLGSGYKRDGVSFFQVNILSDSLSIRYGIYTVSYSAGQDIVLPTKRLGWSMTEQQRQWKKRRNHFLRHFQDTFVLPDSTTEKDLASLMRRRRTRDDELGGQKEQRKKPPQPVELNMDVLCRSIGQSLAETQHAGPKGLPSNLFQAIQGMFNSSPAGDRGPLATWRQLAEAVGEAVELDTVADGLQTAMEKLLDATDDNKVIVQLRQSHDNEPANALNGFESLCNEYNHIWLDLPESSITDDVQDQRKVWVAEVARSMLFSSYGVVIQDVPLFGPQNLETSQEYRGKEPPSSALPASSPRSSQLTPEPPGSDAGTDGTIARLALLAPSITTREHTWPKQHGLLSHWPAERGHDTDSYVSVVAAGSDAKLKANRERQLKREGKRRSLVDTFRRQTMMRQSMSGDRGDDFRGSSPGPAHAQVMSSQAGPNSSQTQGPGLPPITMSQPVSGAFGTRKKKSKAKRKSGFR